MGTARPPPDHAALEAEIAELRDQVKGLVRTESKLHRAQRRLDNQISLFRKLYDLGQRTNADFDLPAILREILAFALEQLAYQQGVILLDDRGTGTLTVHAHLGYSEEDGAERVARVALAHDDPLVAAARERKKVFYRDDAATEPAYAAAETLGMHRFLAFPLETGKEQLVGLLIAGCTRDEEGFFVRVDTDGDAAHGLANLAAQASAAVNKCLLFRALAEERNQLDENVRKRTQELSEAYANLAKLDTLKTKFFANVSHELRTPLTLSIGPLELLLRDGGGAVGAEAAGPLRSVYKNQLRLLKLINDLLDFSKLEAGQMTTRFAKEDVASTMRAQVSMLEAAAHGRGITLALDLPDTPVEVYLDTAKFEKIFMNLLSNAFKFTPDGGRIGVRLTETESAVQIAVTDTGIGIPADAQTKIFDRFFQVQGSDTRQYAGTGIGLALVKEFTELHGGTVAVESTVGAGATFTLTFKRGRAHIGDDAIDATTAAPVAVPVQQLVEFAAEDDAVEDDEAPGEAAPPPVDVEGAYSAYPAEDPAARATVLVVDDTPDMRRFLASVLRPHFHVKMARDGVEALEKLQRELPDIVISDVMMPRMGGKELCAAIKSSPGALGRTPVILVTAKAEMAMKLDGLSSGADDYLVKPFDVEELLCRARNLVLVRRQEKRLATAHAALKAKDERLQRDLAEARGFQQRLLPALPVLGEVSVHAVYRPLDMVGGDIFDVTALGPGRHRVFVADVTGHGVQASLRTMTLKAEYDRACQGLDDPGQILAALNRRLASTYQPLELLCTAVCLDVEARPRGGARVRYASAAAPPMIHVARGEWREVSTGGTFLGTTNAGVELGAGELELQPGDRLAVFTDGLCEQSGEGHAFFETARIGAALAARGLAAPEAVLHLMDAFDTFRGARGVADDVTLLVLESAPRAFVTEAPRAPPP